MKVLKEGEFSPQHTDVVFMNRQSATERDMTKTIGRFNEQKSEIAFLDDKGLGTRYKALFRSGFGLHIESVNGALYVSDINDVIKSLNEHANDYESMSALNESIDTVVYVSFDEFCNSLNESQTDTLLDLDFTHKDLGEYSYTVGHVTTDGMFTLRPEIANIVNSDFTIVQSDSDEPSFDIDLTTLSAGEVVNIIKFLRKVDKAEINESVQVDALAEVTKLLSNLRVSKRHGDDDAVQAILDELNTILDSYNDVNPPAKGVEYVKNEIKSITKDRDIVTESLSWLRKAGW
ncbi:hypothetical protein BCU85_17370 [Vibrio lentus]|uniref:hypothetical protein n=1 Tax=Vibrio lentus TaxID=136468 RepID=UPI000C82B287|nr:hypothetical protein [Vibrio lentus]MCC4818030.1 hypothetical protein [Vibrio lentus]PMG72967.1 hypothetical protein BCU85_17370 [Vibrio lentus]PMK89919.1 hypothetical protein BCT88_21355 [Vibrio lentus]PML25479.1 hypothetical protein BCT80_19515 [Vibrio lentus]PMM27947.1 hypothetical protein BCT57_15800 [Vibrio lentus]